MEDTFNSDKCRSRRPDLQDQDRTAQMKRPCRKTVKIINDKLVEFKTHFAGKDMQDYIAMVVLWYATTAGERGNNESDLTQKLTEIETILDKALQK